MTPPDSPPSPRNASMMSHYKGDINCTSSMTEKRNSVIGNNLRGIMTNSGMSINEIDRQFNHKTLGTPKGSSGRSSNALGSIVVSTIKKGAFIER